MSNKARIVIAVLCGVLLAVGVVCCFIFREESFIATVGFFALVYLVYLVILLKKLREQAKNDAGKQSPLKRR